MSNDPVDRLKSELLVAIKDQLSRRITAKLPDMLDAITAKGGMYLTPEEWDKHAETLPDALLTGAMVAVVCALDAEYDDCRLFRKGADAALTFYLKQSKELEEL